MLLTRNHFWLSLSGSLWVFFFGFTQWWFSTPLPETITSLALAFIGFAYLFVALKKPLVVAGAALLVVFSLNFVLFFYPPYQVPLAWLAVFLAAGFLLTGGRWQLFQSRLRIRLPITAGSALLVLIVLYFFYQDAKGKLPPSPIPITRDSGTRGQRNGFGENVLGIHGGPYSTKRYPLVLGNACEASNYILMFPVVLIAWARNYILKIKNSRLISALLIYLLLSPPGCS